MKTLLLVEQTEEGRIRITAAEGPENGMVEKAIIALYNTGWNATRWVQLLGCAQQMIEQGIARSLVDDYQLYDDDEYYESEEDYLLSPEDSEPQRSWWHKEEPEPDPLLEKKQNALQLALLEWREQKSEQLEIPDYEVLKHVVVQNIVKAVPLTERELLKVRCYGNRTHERYGEELLTLIQKTVSEVEAQSVAEGEAQAVVQVP